MAKPEVEIYCKDDLAVAKTTKFSNLITRASNAHSSKIFLESLPGVRTANVVLPSGFCLRYPR